MFQSSVPRLIHPQLTPIACYWNPQHQPPRHHLPHRSELLINPVINFIVYWCHQIKNDGAVYVAYEQIKYNTTSWIMFYFLSFTSWRLYPWSFPRKVHTYILKVPGLTSNPQSIILLLAFVGERMTFRIFLGCLGIPSVIVNQKRPIALKRYTTVVMLCHIFFLVTFYLKQF